MFTWQFSITYLIILFPLVCYFRLSLSYAHADSRYLSVWLAGSPCTISFTVSLSFGGKNFGLFLSVKVLTIHGMAWFGMDTVCDADALSPSIHTYMHTLHSHANESKLFWQLPIDEWISLLVKCEGKNWFAITLARFTLSSTHTHGRALIIWNNDKLWKYTLSTFMCLIRLPSFVWMLLLFNKMVCTRTHTQAHRAYIGSHSNVDPSPFYHATLCERVCSAMYELGSQNEWRRLRAQEIIS